jgi:hypothetical protein
VIEFHRRARGGFKSGDKWLVRTPKKIG